MAFDLTSKLPRVLYRVILPQCDLPLLPVDHVFDKDFLRMLRYELANESRIPQFTGYTKVLATSPQGYGFAALDCSGYGIGREIVLLAASDRHQSGEDISRYLRLRKGQLTSLMPPGHTRV